MNLKCWSILVIEDDAAINDVVCSTLKGEGYECVSAYSGTEARLLLQAEPSTYSFDLVICDLMLPGMPGEEVVAFIRAQSNVPILVISAKAEWWIEFLFYDKESTITWLSRLILTIGGSCRSTFEKIGTS